MLSDPLLSVSVQHQLGTLRLDVDFATRAPWTVLFGPSGSGKSTLLRIVAGLVRPQQGRVEVLGSTVSDSTRSLWTPPHLRPMRWASQREALFPHKTVRANLACGMGPRTPPAEVDQALAAFGLLDLASAYPHQLSGGQRQRVSVARAAVGARRKLLLLDEPFAGLDAAVRDDLLASLREWLQGSPVISVTHDVAEASILADEVLRIREGRIVEQGFPAEVLQREREAIRLMLAEPARSSAPGPVRIS